MQRPNELFDLFDRVVVNAKVHIEKLPNGRCLVTVSTLHNIVLASFESADEAECERHLREAGYKRIPPYVAHEIDILR